MFDFRASRDRKTRCFLLLQFSKIQFLECTQKPRLESWFDENLATKDQTKCKRGILLPLSLSFGHLPWDNGSRSRSCTGTTCCPGNRKTVSLWSVFGSRRSNRRPVYCRSARTIKPCWNRTPPLKWNEQPLYRDNMIFWYWGQSCSLEKVWWVLYHWKVFIWKEEKKGVISVLLLENIGNFRNATRNVKCTRLVRVNVLFLLTNDIYLLLDLDEIKRSSGNLRRLSRFELFFIFELEFIVLISNDLFWFCIKYYPLV